MKRSDQILARTLLELDSLLWRLASAIEGHQAMALLPMPAAAAPQKACLLL